MADALSARPVNRRCLWWGGLTGCAPEFTIDAKVTQKSVHLHRQGKLVRTHLRATCLGQIIVDDADMPDSHKAAVGNRLVGVKARVKILGPQAETFIEGHYRKSRRPKQTLEAADRRCHDLVTLNVDPA